MLDNFKSLLRKIDTLFIYQLFALSIMSFYNFLLFNFDKIATGNASARVLLVVGPMLKIGNPYKDLWEYVPPGYLIIVSIWVYLFGMDMISFRMFHVFLIVLMMLCFILISKKIFK